MTRARVLRRHRLFPRVYSQRPQRTEGLPPLSLIISSGSSPKVSLFYILDPSSCEWNVSTLAPTVSVAVMCVHQNPKLNVFAGASKSVCWQFLPETTRCLTHCPALAVSPPT